MRIPNTMSEEARNLIIALLNRNPRKRLGAGPGDAEELKQHKFFSGINWQDVQNEKLKMP